MKKYLILLVVALFLTSCAAKADSTYVVPYNQQTYTVNTLDQTITSDGNVYSYSLNGNQITITYPNGAQYWRTLQSSGSFGGLSDDYDENKYVSGDVLTNVLSAEVPSNRPQKNYLLIIIAFVFGIWNIVSPRSSWYLSHGWRYKNAEPSEASLVLGVVGGVIAVLAAVFYLLS